MRFQDADLLEFLERTIAGRRLCIVVGHAVEEAERVLRRIFDVGVIDPELVQQRHVLGRGGQHVRLLRQIPTRAEVVARAANDQHFDVIVDVRFEDQVGVDLPHPGRHGVQAFRAVERQIGDLVGDILFVADDISWLLLSVPGYRRIALAPPR